MFLNKHKMTTVTVLLSLVAIHLEAMAGEVRATSVSDDKAQLTLMLHDFLAGAGDKAAHERFWAEDLIYTSSRGTRTTKAEIMQDFDTSDEDESEEAGPIYSAADVQIKLYGTNAVVAFRLIATPVEESVGPSSEVGAQEYFNTGTFLKRDGIWKAVAWQATQIPEDRE